MRLTFFSVITLLFVINIASVAKTPLKVTNLKPVELAWLGNSPEMCQGVTWGTPWPQGALQPAELNLIETNSVELQSWPLAFWPDGSIKWSGHAVAGNISDKVLTLNYSKKSKRSPKIKGVAVVETSEKIVVNTGVMECTINKTGNVLISSVVQDSRKTAVNGRLVLINQDAANIDESTIISSELFNGVVNNAVVEQSGAVRTVIKIEGIHVSESGKSLFPFVVRLYFYANGNTFKMMHSFIYDADENTDFIKGLGVRFEVPMADELYNRHVRFVGDNGGVFREAVQTLTGLRREPSQEARDSQINGEMVTNINPYVYDRLQYVPAFGDYSLSQLSANGFGIKKRTSQGHGWISSATGNRASGVAYIGGASGGVAFALRDFWQSHPSQIDIRSAASDMAEFTVWLWAPDSQPMDLRFYHDGLGQDTYQAQWEGLEITYEDYEEGYGTPYGVARTSELNFWFTSQTPSNENLTNYSKMVNDPPLLSSSMLYINSTGVFGPIWTAREVSDGIVSELEDDLDRLFNYYQVQQEQHSWYGFWDYGDFMHTYDGDRHVWRYDVGGYAWDNSELSTDLWLWYYYLHTGKKEAFRMAEAMTRHTGEVDVHHVGPFAPLGSRHNVHHWGCSAKQMRISTVANRRFMYYLTADERIGDLMDAQVEALRTLQDIKPMRKRLSGAQLYDEDSSLVRLGFGTDWGAVAAAWFTQWERTGDGAIGQRLKNSMKTIAAQPNGFYTGAGFMNMDTGEFVISDDYSVSVSHLSAVFGLFELCSELVDVMDIVEFNNAWIDYCQYYNASSEEQEAKYGQSFGRLGLRQGHSRLTAYAANKLNCNILATRAKSEFLGNKKGVFNAMPQPFLIQQPNVLNDVIEIPMVSTNWAAQWGLSAMQIMRLIAEQLGE